MAITDKPMTWKEFQAIKSLLVTELQLRPREWIQLLAGHIDSAGGIQNFLNTSGQVTEASAATISANLNYLRYNVLHGRIVGFAEDTAQGGTATQFKLFQTTVTATAGGEIVAVAVGAPALAGYQCCMVITHIWSDQTDGSIALTWTSTGGLTSGLAGTTIATVANTVSPDWNQGLGWKATADNDTIDVACAAGQAGNAQNITFCGYYWYET